MKSAVKNNIIIVYFCINHKREGIHMIKQAMTKKSVRIATAVVFSIIAVMLFMLLSGTKFHSKWSKAKSATAKY